MGLVRCARASSLNLQSDRYSTAVSLSGDDGSYAAQGRFGALAVERILLLHYETRHMKTIKG